MKKITLAALILGAFAASAHAQSSVTIYGQVDAGFVSEHGGKAGPVQKITSGVGGQSRIGFKGVEDMGNGLSAIFMLEAGFKVDDGTLDNTPATGSPSALFNRTAYVGLASKEMGTVTLGRQNTPWYNTLTGFADPFGANYAGAAKNLMPAGGSMTRASNTVQYASPVAGGFSGEAAYSAGEQADSINSGRQWGAALQYKNGPLGVRVGYANRNTDNAAARTSIENSKNTLIGAYYDFTVVKAYASYGINKGVNSSALPNSTAYSTTAIAGSPDSRDMLIGAQIPAGNGNVLASVIHKDDRSRFNRDADQYAVGYSYNLSKRTSAYAMYAKIRNKNGASYTVGNNNEVGSGDSAYNIGLRHSF